MKQQKAFLYTAVFSLPILFASTLALVADQVRTSSRFDPEQLWGDESELVRVKFSSADELERYFDRWGYAWMPEAGATVPPLVVRKIPQDLEEVRDSKRKKSIFFRALLPIVLAENNHIRVQRERFVKILSLPSESRTWEQRRWLANLQRYYRVEGDISDQKVVDTLLRRVDEVPEALALAQAANESAWGTSRFAQLGNNLFGVWTFEPGKGIVPQQRREGLRHAVQVYPSLRASLRAYLRTLNTHPAYRKLRAIREQARRDGVAPDALSLADGLLKYSERGRDYVEEIRIMIRANRLHELGDVSLKTRQQYLETSYRIHFARPESING